MKGMKVNFVKICNVVVALLMLAILVCQFIPYWTADDQAVSISDYVWKPEEYKSLTKDFQKDLDTELDAGSVAGVHIIALVGGILGIWYTITKMGSMLPGLLYGVTGVWGILELTKNPILKVGSIYNTLQILFIVLIVGAVASIGLRIWQKAAAKAKAKA